MSEYRDVSDRKDLSENEKDRIHADNVASWSPLSSKSFEERRKAAEMFGPNWASILSGHGDQ